MKTILLSAVLILTLSAPAFAGRYFYRSPYGGLAYGSYDYRGGYLADNYGGIGVWQNPVWPTWGFQQYVPPVSGYNPGALRGYWNNGYFIPGW
jgi:hypothetical protein